MKPEYKDDMFIVINRKHLRELNDHYENKSGKISNTASTRLLKAVEEFYDIYELFFGERIVNKYYVCNQDELYADQVLKIILDGESKKCTS